ncbi:MAG: hypothetical protein V1676_03035 [Candidatus Diapherotrites archaeon]
MKNMKKVWLAGFAAAALVVGIAALVVLAGGGPTTATPPMSPTTTATQSISPTTKTIYPLWSTEVLDLSFLNKHSESVVIGRVTEILPSKWDTPDGGRPADVASDAQIYTDAIIQVDSTAKGSVPSRLVVRTLGGKIGDHSMDVEDAAKFEVGEKVLLFLTTNDPSDKTSTNGGAHYSVVGWKHGKFTITSDNQAVRLEVPEQYQKLPLEEVLASVTGQ